MRETHEDLTRLQALLEESIERAGSFLRASFEMPEHSLSAERLAAHLQGRLTVALSTVTAGGEPRVAPIGAFFLRGTFYIPTVTQAARARHLSKRPAASLTYFEGIDFAVIAHGTAEAIDADDPRFEELDEVYAQCGGESVTEWEGDGVYLRFEPTTMYTYAREPNVDSSSTDERATASGQLETPEPLEVTSETEGLRPAQTVKLAGMRMRSRALPAVLALVLLAAAATAAVVYAATRAKTRPRAQVGTLTVQPTAVGRPIPSGFVGLTTEYRGLEAYAGTNPAALNPVFVQLLRNLAPGQSPILRVGGDSTDWTWWPVPRMAIPGGVKFSLDGTWLKVASSLATALNGRLILGINFEADSSRVAGAEAQAFIRGIGRPRIAGLELGNEPELYSAFPWYKLPGGQHVRGRPRTYTYADFVQDFAGVSQAIPRTVTLAGPSTGAKLWIPMVGQFLRGNGRVGLVTLHAYPLKHCSAAARVTIPEILSSSSSTGLAASLARAVATVHAHGAAVRIDEMSAITCGGVLGVSSSFATALWSLDALFALARTGVDGVNMQTSPGSWNEVFPTVQTKAGWQASVKPVYYGMLMFAQAAPPGARLLRVTGSAGGQVRTWATKGTDGAIRVVLINDSTAQARTVTLRAPALGGPSALERLLAPSARATQGVTLGGLSFGAETATGQLAGTPTLTPVTPTGGQYVISMPAASAALLTIAP